MSCSVETIADEGWATSVAARFDDLVRPGMRLCLAAGNTTTPFYAEVAGRTSLDDLTLFLLDEFGGLPESDPGRCMSMLSRDLLHQANGRQTVHAPDVDADDPDHAADHYRSLIENSGLDLAIVGLGANGHIGMNEPGSTVDLSTRVVTLDPSTSENAAAYGATTPPSWGITVGMSELMESREVWVLVTGEHKTDILNRTLHGPVDAAVPATFLIEHSNCTFFVDESAAASQTPTWKP